MKKRIWKTVVSLFVALALIFGYGNVVALAEVDDKTEEPVRTAELAGGQVQGTLSVDNMSAIAVTTYGRGGGYIYATATIYYWWGPTVFKTTVGPIANSMGGVSAIAEKQLGGADVLGAQGHHKVHWQAFTWEPKDTILGIAATDSERAKNAIEYMD